MTATEVRKFMDTQLQYAGDYDDTTVLAYTTGTIKAEFGVSTKLSAKGQPIPGCVRNFCISHSFTLNYSILLPFLSTNSRGRICNYNLHYIPLQLERNKLSSGSTRLKGSILVPICIMVRFLFNF